MESIDSLGGKAMVMDEPKIKRDKSKRMEDELRNSEARYRTLFDRSPASITLVDHTGVIVDCNSATEKLSGYSKDEIIGKPFEELLTLNPDDLPKLRERFNMLSKGGPDSPYEFEIIRKDGEKRWIRVLNSLISIDSDLVGIQVISEDITERKKAEEVLHQHTKELATLLRISQGLTTTWDLKRVLQMSIDEAVKLLGLGSGAIYLFEGKELYLWATTPPLPLDFPEEFRHAKLDDHPHIMKAISIRNPIIIKDTRTSNLTPAEQAVSEVRGLRTLLYVPLIGHDKVIGVYILGSVGEPCEISEAKINLSRTLSNQAALAIQDAKLFRELKESEERFRYLVENSNEVIYSVDDKGIVTYISPRIQSLLGYIPYELIGQSFTKFISDEDLEQSKRRLQKNLLGENPPGEYRVLTKSGDIRWIQTSSKPILKGEQVLGVQGILSDITDRKKAEEALQENEEKYRNLVERAHDGIVIVQDGLLKFVNNRLAEILGYTVDEIFNTSFLNYIPPSDHSKIIDIFSRRIKGEKVPNIYEMTALNKDGSEIIIETNSGLITYNGKPAVLAFIRDITFSKQAEEALKETEREYQNLFESMREGFALCEVIQDEKGEPIDYRFLRINPAFSEQSGMDIDKTIGKTIKEVYPDIEPIWIQRYGDVAITQKSIHFEDYNHNTKRHYDAIAFSPEKGKFAMIFRDITDKKKAEEALQASEEKHRTLFETMTQGVVYQNVDGNIISANSAAENILGLTIDQMVGRTSMDPRWKSIHEDGSDFPGDTHPSMVALKTGKEVRNAVMGVFHPDKEKHVWININAVPQFRPGEDKPSQVYTTFEDITHRIEAEEHIKASLSEKELLLKEIHHRVKNNLQVISSMLSLQSMQIMDDDLKAMFRESQGRVQTMAIVHEKMYQSADLAKIGFSDYIRDLTRELFVSYGVDSSKITSNISVQNINLGVDVAIPCGLIINELISNSIKHAFPRGKEGEININLISEENNKYKLIVGDNGVGFPEGFDLNHLESLGLRLVNTLVGQLDGKIELDNDNGSTFKIEFTVPQK
jgi:PAS domain S-box-containing protein